MDKQEFLEQLRKSLSQANDYEFVNDNMAYYEDYLNTEIRKGSTEQEVLTKLGDPRLIAKSLLTTYEAKQNGEGGSLHAQQEYSAGNGFSKKKMPQWLHKTLILLITVGVIALAFFMLNALAPVIIIGIVAYFIYKMMRK